MCVLAYSGHISQSTIPTTQKEYSLPFHFSALFPIEFDICVFFVSILLNRLLYCKLIFARFAFFLSFPPSLYIYISFLLFLFRFCVARVCGRFRLHSVHRFARSHVLLSSLDHLVCCFRRSFFLHFAFTLLRPHILALQSLYLTVDVCVDSVVSAVADVYLETNQKNM